jgi:hypothetical protein
MYTKDKAQSSNPNTSKIKKPAASWIPTGMNLKTFTVRHI